MASSSIRLPRTSQCSEDSSLTGLRLLLSVDMDLRGSNNDLQTPADYVLSGQNQAYTPAWVNQVLAQNFIQITGGNTFVMNLQHYDGSLPYLFATWGAPVMAPDYTMQHDIATWMKAGTSFPMRLSAETRPP